MFMNKEQVVGFLPHRPPFLFIDTVEKIEIPVGIENIEEPTCKDLTGATVLANFEVTPELEILKGHFPGNPILPGVIQVEMMAQASAFVSLGLKQVEDTSKYKVETLLLGVESSKFRKPIFPGMKLQIFASMEKCRGLIATYKCEIHCEGKKVSEAKILAQLIINKRG